MLKIYKTFWVIWYLCVKLPESLDVDFPCNLSLLFIARRFVLYCLFSTEKKNSQLRT